VDRISAGNYFGEIQKAQGRDGGSVGPENRQLRVPMGHDGVGPAAEWQHL